MTDIEFTCSSCNAPLIVAGEGAGMTITCPQCSNQLQVPGPRRIEIGSKPPPIPPIAPGHRQDYRDYDIGFSVRTRNCTLAYISLGLICLSFITGGLLLLPGIICAHIAIGQCDRDPNLLGRSYAKAALTVGYILVCLCVLGIFGILLICASH